MLCLPGLLPVTSFTGSQLPVLSYCVSWCISLLWLQTICSVKHGPDYHNSRSRSSLSAGDISSGSDLQLRLHLLPAKTGDLKMKQQKKEYIIVQDWKGQARGGGRKRHLWFWNMFVHSRKHAKNPMCSARWFLSLRTVLNHLKRTDYA